MQKNLVIIVAGPTASGKSALAMDVASKVGGAIVNADSMQVYKNTPVLSAVPTSEDKKKVPHFLYEFLDATQQNNVVEWLDLAVPKIKNLWSKGMIPVVTGGTGLYIDNLINGTTPIPETGDKAKSKAAEIIGKGLDVAYAELKEIDKVSAEKIKPADSTRIRRALEVFYDTGIALSEWHKKPMVKKLENAKFVVVKIIPSAEELDERIYQRFEMMIEKGAVEEVKALREKGISKNMPAMKALGVPELLDYLDGKTSLEEAKGLAKLHSRQYAKRQRTWFNNKLRADIVIRECYKGDEKILSLITNMLHNAA